MLISSMWGIVHITTVFITFRWANLKFSDTSFIGAANGDMTTVTDPVE
ncbi:hypothetical protein HanIR_Chr03g0106821 [Helianthus annuus]|nr:hypothetical protein HanIR_Chr03g0106821 [Helianthus annuus]